MRSKASRRMYVPQVLLLGEHYLIGQSNMRNGVRTPFSSCKPGIELTKYEVRRTCKLSKKSCRSSLLPIPVIRHGNVVQACVYNNPLSLGRRPELLTTRSFSNPRSGNSIKSTDMFAAPKRNKQARYRFIYACIYVRVKVVAKKG